MSQFKIQGQFDQDDGIYLYWNNQDGWVDFSSATTFDAKDINLNMPMETNGIAIIDNCEVVSVEEAKRKLA